MAADVAEPQQLGYINVVPACKDMGGFLSSPTFDTFGETVSKINAMLTAQPIPGTIVQFLLEVLYSDTEGLRSSKAFKARYGS